MTLPFYLKNIIAYLPKREGKLEKRMNGGLVVKQRIEVVINEKNTISHIAEMIHDDVRTQLIHIIVINTDMSRSLTCSWVWSELVVKQRFEVVICERNVIAYIEQMIRDNVRTQLIHSNNHGYVESKILLLE